MKPELAATVIVPTSIDRGPLLQFSVGSILKQTVENLEVFIIGDGVHDVTRDAVRDLQRSDERIRFFDHPKGERRGEQYRHEALGEARGRIICYLCDRDLYFPDHVSQMAELLSRADFAHTLPVRVDENGFSFDLSFNLADCAEKEKAVRVGHGISLSFFGHTLAAYRGLPVGWRPTPSGQLTDIYFSSRFIRCASSAGSGYHPTALSFHRGSHPGWSTARRLPELRNWSERLRQAQQREQIRDKIDRDAHQVRERSMRLLERTILIGGQPASLHTPRRLFELWLGRLVIYFGKRPDAPWFNVLRRGWRRLRYGMGGKTEHPT